ncbi:hypothetical protein D9M71_832350 [compost metagenome]
MALYRPNMNSTSTTENGRPASTTMVCMASKLPANSRPIVTRVITTDQNTTIQCGASSSTLPPVHDRLAIITAPESAGVRNSTKPTNTATPMTILAAGKYSSNW